MIIVSSDSMLLNQPPTTPSSQCPAQIKDLDAYYIRAPEGDGECPAQVCISFTPLVGAEISRYAIYRSFIGFVSPIVDPSVLSGKTLQVSIDMGPTQTITFDGVTPLVEQMNADLLKVNVYMSSLDPTNFVFRATSDVGAPVSLQLIGGTALTDLSQTARTITEQSEDVLIAYVEAQPTDDQTGVEFCDPDGDLNDFYAVATINLSNELSYKSSYISPTITTGKLCCIYGIVSDIDGVRIPDAPVSAQLIQYYQTVSPSCYLYREKKTVYSDSSGKFKICLLQGAQVHLEIPDTNYYKTIVVPEQARISITDLDLDRSYKFDKRIS